MKIGFVGYSKAKFDEEKAKIIIDDIFIKFNKIAEEENVKLSIVSGATYYGIVKLVYDKAFELGFETIGVMCKEGYDCDLYPCDKIYAIGNKWGDESFAFVNMIDILVRIGGGPQSLKEVQMAKQRGIQVIEYELPEIEV